MWISVSSNLYYFRAYDWFPDTSMYDQEDDYAEEGEESEEISNDIWQEACWIVISAYFDEKG